MGWSGGSSLLSSIWAIIRQDIPSHRRVAVLVELMKEFEDFDCDTLSEIERLDWPETKVALDRMYGLSADEWDHSTGPQGAD